MTTTETIQGWHFSTLDCTLGYGDGRKIVAGETLNHDGEIVLCERGLHASARLIDALKYAPGPYLWRVELSGQIERDDDKMVATHRKALWGFDASDVLRVFARRVALDAVEKYWDADKLGPFPEITLAWLRTGNEELRAAAAAAAEAAAWAAERAARAAAWAASAASRAARAAAWAAERAARDAARSAGAAAWAASAAQVAEWAADFEQNQLLESMVEATWRRIDDDAKV